METKNLDFTSGLVKLFVTITAIIFGLVAEAQEILIGFNLDKSISKTAIAFLDNTDESFEADQNGIIRISGIADGEHIVTLFIEGYQTRTELVNTGQNALYSFDMTPLGATLNAVEIEDTKNRGPGMVICDTSRLMAYMPRRK